MKREEKLKEFCEKLNEIKVRLKLTQEEWVAHNKLFNNWVQDEIDVKDQDGEVHLTDILRKWDQSRDTSP